MYKSNNLDIFHDSILNKIVLDWRTGNASIFLQVSQKLGANLQEFVLDCVKIIDIHIPKLDEWGESIYVNEVTIEKNTLIIEMQSGDKIKIKFQSITFN